MDLADLEPSLAERSGSSECRSQQRVCTPHGSGVAGRPTPTAPSLPSSAKLLRRTVSGVCHFHVRSLMLLVVLLPWQGPTDLGTSSDMQRPHQPVLGPGQQCGRSSRAPGCRDAASSKNRTVYVSVRSGSSPFGFLLALDSAPRPPTVTLCPFAAPSERVALRPALASAKEPRARW